MEWSVKDQPEYMRWDGKNTNLVKGGEFESEMLSEKVQEK